MPSLRDAVTAIAPTISDKFKSSDSDIRVMALIDLNKEISKVVAVLDSPAFASSHQRQHPYYAEEVSEKVLTIQVLNLLSDPNAEVKNAAVPCLATMVKKAREAYVYLIISTITSGIGLPAANAKDVDEEKRDISCLALKSVVAEMPTDSDKHDRSVRLILDCIHKNVGIPDANPQLSSELLQILADVYQRFTSLFMMEKNLQDTAFSNLLDILTIPRLSVRKRAVPALATYIPICPSRFDDLKIHISEGFAKGDDSAKAWIAVVAGLARTSVAFRVGELITEGWLVAEIMKQTADLEDTDAIEGALMALESLVLRCPTEISPFVGQITNMALELVKFDPNYVEFDDEDVDMEDADEEEDDDDDFDNDIYSDDDDDSWKIRRSAAKLLVAIIGTRNDLLLDFYKSAALLLVSRFNEREESVRLEVLAAFEALLKQTTTARAVELAVGGKNKRKWDDEMDQGAEESAVSQLYDMRPQLVKAILKQASSKSVNTRQQSFVILRQVVEALGGGLDAESDTICVAAQAALRTAENISPSLTIAVLTFLNAFFTHHLARSYVAHLPELTSSIVRCMRDKLQRVNFESFDTASALAKAIRPLEVAGASLPQASYDQPIHDIFSVTTSVLGDSTVDGDVREKALITLGNLLVHEGDTLLDQLQYALPLLTARLGNESTATTAVVVIGRVAESPICVGEAFDAWLLTALPEVVIALRRNKRSATKAAEFTCLERILTRIGEALPTDTATGIILDLQPYIDTPAALQAIALVLSNQPGSREVVSKVIVPHVMVLMETPSINPTLMDSLADFWGSYVDGDIDCAIRLVPTLVLRVCAGKTAIPDASRGGTSIFTTFAKCIGAVVNHSQRNLAGILATFQRTIKSDVATEPEVYLALMCIGEIGRSSDLSTNAGLLERIIEFFTHKSEEVRSAAAFAAGNLAVGSPEEYLHSLVRHIDSALPGASRLLLLHALKEVTLHSSPAQLEVLADTLWRPLFVDTDALPNDSDVGDDGVRNVKAACIGKLTTAAPARFLPELQELLKATPRDRALVAAAIRYTFTEASSAHDEQIAPIVGDFLALMKDDNLIVRRLSLASLNAAIQNKPHLIIDKLPILQPFLYQETEVKKELQREVQMGPWKVIEDDGLENRKTAYETMYTLLATCFNKIDLPTFTERVLAALRDVNEVKIVGLMLLLRLGQLAPTVVVPRLDEVAGYLQTIMKDLDVKEDTIKQDLERKEEMQRSTLRTAVPLYRISPAAQAPKFHAFVAGLLKSDSWKEFSDYQI